MIKVAVIGSGYWGKNLVRNFHELGALAAVCDKDPEVLTKFKKAYKGIPVVQSIGHVLEDFSPPIDAVAIATPSETHYDLAKRSLLAGKHVFVEKPLALTEEEAEELVQVAERHQLTLMVGHILQYHGAVVKLKALIDSGDLGRIQYLYSNRLNIGKIRAEENILWSFAPHDISVILMLLGEMPETIYATGGTYLQDQIPDTTITTLDFPRGVKAHIFVSWLHPFKEQKLVVVGDKKMAVFDDISEQKLELFSHEIHWLKRVPVAAKAEAEVVEINMEEPLRAECQHFLTCIADGLTPKTDGREGLRVLQVLQACQASLNQGGCKIRLAGHETGNPASPCTKSANSYELNDTDYFVHKSSYVDEGVHIGGGTQVWHFCHILRGTRLGRNCNIGQNVMIGPDVIIGNGCKIQNNVSIYKGVTLEDEVFCGPSMVFTNVYNPRSAIPRMDEIRPTLVKRGATIGANATIICGITIGSHAFIGSGAVVLKDVPDHALMVGNPAKQAGWMCVCGIQFSFDEQEAICRGCGRRYQKRGNEQIVEAGR
jgi:UDP-2-acetamido-3-amino-2,3-dideoxy-glucuronate N-acetyltransferase